MAALAQLRKQAKEMGLAPSVIRGAETSEELQAEIDNFSNKATNGSSTKKSSARVVKKAVVKKKSGSKSTTAKKSASKTKTATKKSSAVKSKPAAKKSAAKRQTSRKTTTTRATAEISGRHTLDDVDYSYTEGWNAREGSAPDRIIKALKKFRGNRDKVYDHLESDVWDFVGKKMANGSKRTKADALAMLAYRISRTAWDFAVRTEQHNPSQERVQYGTGGTGQGIWKSKASKARAKTAAAKKRGASKKSGAKRKTARR